MKKSLVVIFALGVFLSQRALANDVASAGAIDSSAPAAAAVMGAIDSSAPAIESSAPSPEEVAAKQVKRAGIVKIMEQTGVDKIVTTFTQRLTAQMKKSFPRVPDAFWEKFSAKLNPEYFESDVIAVYDRYLTGDDVKALLDFYATPSGKKMLEAMPKIQLDITKAAHDWSMRIMTDARADLEKEGYLSKPGPTGLGIESSAPPAGTMPK